MTNALLFGPNHYGALIIIRTVIILTNALLSGPNHYGALIIIQTAIIITNKRIIILTVIIMVH